MSASVQQICASNGRPWAGLLRRLPAAAVVVGTVAGSYGLIWGSVSVAYGAALTSGGAEQPRPGLASRASYHVTAVERAGAFQPLRLDLEEGR